MKKTIRSLLILGFLVGSYVHAQTYFLESYGRIPAPYPFDPYGGLEPMVVLNAANHIYLIEDNADDFASLQSFSRSMSMETMDGPMLPGGGTNGGDFYSDSFNYHVPTNGLWLEMTNLANGWAFLNLHNATNQVYEIFSKTNLSVSTWNIEGELWPSDTNSMPFTIQVLNRRDNLFFWARDWTGIASLGNQTPEWWFWYYFDTVDLSDTNLDIQGDTLASDYSGARSQAKYLKLASAPVLAITNPVANIVSQPVIQIYGFSDEPLSSISYDLSNALGVVTGLPSEITDQFYDTNSFGFSTNYFECLDVPLTNGLNTIVLHATDLAGNTTTTNFNFTLDYSNKTNPPVIKIAWPQAGTQISGNNFTCRGSVDDPTATVSVQLAFNDGNTNYFVNGIYTNTFTAGIDRIGNFWLENLPLHSGTNNFTLVVQDAAGNVSTTNFTAVQSSLSLTVNPVSPDSQLWQATANLTGTISATNYAVWVNGVKGHNNSNGTWSATNVPVNNGGTANFTATAYAPDEQQPDGSYGN